MSGDFDCFLDVSCGLFNKDDVLRNRGWWRYHAKIVTNRSRRPRWGYPWYYLMNSCTIWGNKNDITLTRHWSVHSGRGGSNTDRITLHLLVEPIVRWVYLEMMPGTLWAEPRPMWSVWIWFYWIKWNHNRMILLLVPLKTLYRFPFRWM